MRHTESDMGHTDTDTSLKESDTTLTDTDTKLKDTARRVPETTGCVVESVALRQNKPAQSGRLGVLHHHPAPLCAARLLAARAVPASRSARHFESHLIITCLLPKA